MALTGYYNSGRQQLYIEVSHASQARQQLRCWKSTQLIRAQKTYANATVLRPHPRLSTSAQPDGQANDTIIAMLPERQNKKNTKTT